MDSQHLLVPIKVQGLVIDDIVIEKRGVVEIERNRYAANDGRWSPQLQDYRLLTTSLRAPGPRPFYGATRAYQGHPADQLVLDRDSSALPENKDRGVYLHWVLPSGLRHAYTPGLLDFPALPDHWLIVRFCRRGATPNLWKALEAVIYRQPESLIGSWNAAPRDHAVHQNWFSTRDAGKIWFIRPQPDKEGVFPADADKTAAQTAVRPTPEQLAELKQLNQVQSEADAVSRELAALQQDLYARWWKLCALNPAASAPI
jgi:hypothetical protein